MRVLVTGGAGFIGGHVVDELSLSGHEPVIFDHLGRAGHSPLSEGVFLGDVRDATAVTEAFAHVDGWIHLAAVLGTQETVANPGPSAETNILGGLNVLEAAAQYNLPGVYIAVGNHWMRNTYSITKTAIEQFCGMYRDERGVRVNVVRCVNAYGPRQRAAQPFASGRVRKIMPAFICRALSGRPIEVYGDGEQISDMVYVEDVASTLVAALEAAELGSVVNRVLECGPQESLTVNQVAAQVADTVEQSHTGVRVPIEHLPMRPGEIPNDRVSADARTLKAVGVDPDEFLAFDHGCRRTVAYFAQSEGVEWTASPSSSPR